MDSGTLYALMVQAADTAGNVSGSISYTVSIGDLVSMATSIIAAGAAYVRIRERLISIETRLDPMWQVFLDRRKPPRG